VTLAIIDLDDFKQYNTRVGHNGADAILVELSTRWSCELRPDDCLARYGGDEFALVCPRSSQAEVVRLLERLRETAPTPVTFSAGLATWLPGETAEDLERRADAALFAAKDRGAGAVTAAPIDHAARRRPNVIGV